MSKRPLIAFMAEKKAGMNRFVFLCLLAAAFLLGGCRYEAPLTEAHDREIDPAVLGVWESIPPATGKEPSRRLLVLAYSPTEYLIHYPVGSEGIYFRGYPVEVAGVACVQLQTIGTAKGIPAADNRRLFHVAAYEVSGDRLTVRTLNTERVPESLRTREALRAAFAAAHTQSDLFTVPVHFRRIRP